MLERKTTLTKTWLKSDGTKVPLPLMNDDYIKNAYRRCTEILLGNHVVIIDGSRDAHRRTAPISIQTAAQWKDIFEQEAKRRNIRLPRVDKDTYAYRVGKTITRRKYQKDRNKKFDEKFN